jgi:membrane-associated phospholipid phosphatase
MGYYALARLNLARLVTEEYPVLEWERWLLGGHSAPELLVPMMELRLFNLLMIVTYLSFYPFLLGLPAWLLVRGIGAAFQRLRLTWAVAAVAGYTMYFVTPTQSPYYVLELYQHPPFTLAKTLIGIATEAGVAFRYDAFPSMHVALALLGVLAIRAGLSAARRRLAWLWFGMLLLATMATGSHYLLDLAAGILLAAIVWVATRPKHPGQAASKNQPGVNSPEPRHSKEERGEPTLERGGSENLSVPGKADTAGGRGNLWGRHPCLPGEVHSEASSRLRELASEWTWAGRHNRRPTVHISPSPSAWSVFVLNVINVNLWVGQSCFPALPPGRQGCLPHNLPRPPALSVSDVSSA